jgi:hypothetical protein
MKTKLQTLKDAAAANNWQKAVAIAARFPRLDGIREAVLDAHMAYTNPRFLTQVGKDVEVCKQSGRDAITDSYGL